LAIHLGARPLISVLVPLPPLKRATLGGSPTHLAGSVAFLPSRCRPPHTRRTVLVSAASRVQIRSGASSNPGTPSSISGFLGWTRDLSHISLGKSPTLTPQKPCLNNFQTPGRKSTRQNRPFPATALCSLGLKGI
jgi:hypothetical protein